MKDAQNRIELVRKICRTGSRADAGRALGVTPQRISQLLRKAKYRPVLPAWTRGLDIRTAHILLAEGFKSRRTVEEAIERGDYIHRIGPVRQAELREWLRRGGNE